MGYSEEQPLQVVEITLERTTVYSVICKSVTVDAKSQPLLIGSVILTSGMVAPEGFMASELN